MSCKLQIIRWKLLPYICVYMCKSCICLQKLWKKLWHFLFFSLLDSCEIMVWQLTTTLRISRCEVFVATGWLACSWLPAYEYLFPISPIWTVLTSSVSEEKNCMVGAGDDELHKGLWRETGHQNYMFSGDGADGNCRPTCVSQKNTWWWIRRSLFCVEQWCHQRVPFGSNDWVPQESWWWSNNYGNKGNVYHTQVLLLFFPISS